MGTLLPPSKLFSLLPSVRALEGVKKGGREKNPIRQPKARPQPLTSLPISRGSWEFGKAALQNMVRRDADSSRAWFRAPALFCSSQTLLLPGAWENRKGSHGYHWKRGIHCPQASCVNKHCTRAHWKLWLSQQFRGSWSFCRWPFPQDALQAFQTHPCVTVTKNYFPRL